MTWVLLLIAAWLAVSLPLALLLAHAIRRADQEAAESDPRAVSGVVPDPSSPRRSHPVTALPRKRQRTSRRRSPAP